MAVAVKNQDEGDEHSCFADNTHRDVFLNAKSINNINNGSCMRTGGSTISGAFLLEILALVNESEQTALTAISTTGYLDYQLMDETIDNFNNLIMFAILRLRKQDDALAKAEKSITRDTIDPRV